jgi:hypothetical protein
MILWQVYYAGSFMGKFAAKTRAAASRMAFRRWGGQKRLYAIRQEIYLTPAEAKQWKQRQRNPGCRKVKGARSVTLRNMRSVTIIRRRNGTVGIRGVKA